MTCFSSFPSTFVIFAFSWNATWGGGWLTWLLKIYRVSTYAHFGKRCPIKRAEGVKQSRILHADGEAQAIKLVNEAADKYFVGNAQLLKRLEITEASMDENAKIVIPAGTELVNVIGDLAGVLPLKKKDT